MSITVNHKHHRNPSGCHNKVRWILSKCKWNYKKYKRLKRKLLKNLNTQLQNDKQAYSWSDAICIAQSFLTNSRIPPEIKKRHTWAYEYDLNHLQFKESAYQTDLIWHSWLDRRPSYNQRDFRKFIFLCKYTGSESRLRGRIIPIVVDDWHSFFRGYSSNCYMPVAWAELPDPYNVVARISK